MDDPQRIVVESPTLKPGQPVPSEHTPDGRDQSPELTWRNVPAGTKELVVTFEDQDADPRMSRIPLLHWLVYAIPPSAKGLPEGLPGQTLIVQPDDLLGACQAYTVFDIPGYHGPQPFPGELHHYRIAVFALDAELNLAQGLFANFVLSAMKGHVIGEGDLVVTYQRKAKP